MMLDRYREVLGQTVKNDDFKLTLKLWKSEVSFYQYEWTFVQSQIISYIAIVFKLDFLLQTSH